MFLNAAALQLVGASTPDAILGTPLRDVFHVESRPLLDDLIEQWQSGGATPTADARIVRGDGAITDVDVTGTLLDDARAPPIQVIVRDITSGASAEAGAARERGAAAARLRRRAGRRLGLEPRNRRASCTRRAGSEMLGYADDEIEPHVSAWERAAASRRPRPRRRAARQRRARRARPTKASSGSATRTATTSTCSRAACRSAASPDGRSCASSARISISPSASATEAALRESEERLTLAFAGAQEGVWDWNLETGAVVYSSRWKQMLGYGERRDRAARQRLGAAAASRRPGRARSRCNDERRARRADLRGRIPPAAQGRPLRPRAVARVSRCAASPADRSCASSARTSTSTAAASRPRPSARAPSSSRGWCSRRRTSGGASRARCTISSASS